jgi:hypothetical protein
LGRPSIATNFITDFFIEINDLVLIYRIMTVVAALSSTAGRVVEFCATAGAGCADV